MKRRKAVFWQEGRSETWKRLDKGIKRTIAFRKKQYEEKMTKKTRELWQKWSMVLNLPFSRL